MDGGDADTDLADGQVSESEFLQEFAVYRYLRAVVETRDDIAPLARLVDDFADATSSMADMMELSGRGFEEHLESESGDRFQQRFEAAALQLVEAGKALDTRKSRGTRFEQLLVGTILQNIPNVEPSEEQSEIELVRLRARSLRLWAERLRGGMTILEKLEQLYSGRASNKPGRRRDVAQTYILVWALDRGIGDRELALRLVESEDESDPDGALEAEKLERQLSSARTRLLGRLGFTRKTWRATRKSD